MMLVIPVVMLLFQRQFGWALVLFFVAGLSDGLDGYLAKRNNWSSRLGSILDPLADKLLLVSSIFALGWLALIPFWLVIAVIVRDIVIICGAVAAHFVMGRYEMEPTWISKSNTFFQILLALTVMFSFGLYSLPPLIVEVLIYTVLATTVLSGSDYVYTWGRRAYRFKKDQQQSNQT
jgi:cardiolipin synthase